jgi:hypothetical protein
LKSGANALEGRSILSHRSSVLAGRNLKDHFLPIKIPFDRIDINHPAKQHTLFAGFVKFLCRVEESSQRA